MNQLFNVNFCCGRMLYSRTSSMYGCFAVPLSVHGLAN